MSLDTAVFTNKEYETFLSFWKDKVADFPDNFKFQAAARIGSGEEDLDLELGYTLNVSPDLYPVLQKVNDTGSFVCLLTLMTVLLQEYTRSQQVIIASPLLITNDETVGFPAMKVPLALHVNKQESLRQNLGAIQKEVAEYYSYQGYPLHLIDSTSTETDRLKTNVVMQYGAIHNALPLEDTLADLLVDIDRDGEQFVIRLYFRPSVFDRNFIKNFGSHYARLTEALADLDTSVKDLEILSEKEKEQILGDFNTLQLPSLPFRSIVHAFAAHVRERPECIAAIFEGRKLTFKELDHRSTQLARALQKQGAEPGDIVGICLDRSLEMMVALLGVLKTGGAYLPIDPAFPGERIRFMLEDCVTSIVITEQACIDKIPDQHDYQLFLLDDNRVYRNESTRKLRLSRHSSSVAYVIYTSGSTGRPKGVIIPDSALLNYLLGLKNALDLADFGMSFGTLTHISTDLGNTAVFSALCFGGTLHVFSRDMLNEPEQFFAYCRKETIDLIKFTPSILNFLLDAQPEEKLSVRYLMTGGEAMSWELLEKARRQFTGEQIFNHYGPTEATIGVLVGDLTTELTNTGFTPPLGRPLANSRIYILDERMRPVAVGVTGMLFIGGPGVSNGYLNQPELTRSKFVPSPFGADQTLYSTGDLACWLPDGRVVFLGRRDDQVKIRAYRIELGEIEHALISLPSVTAAAVKVVHNEVGEDQLAAFLVVPSGMDKEAIQRELQEILPAYMVPQVWIELDQLPLTANGKLDRKALAEPLGRKQDKQSFVAPQTETEQALATIWGELLGVEKIGIHDNFFEIGGHSLMAIRMISALRSELGIEIEINAVFSYPTIAAMVEHLKEQHPGTFLPPIEPQPESDRIPLSFSQERLWFIDQLDGTVQYHIDPILRLRGALDVAALEFALRSLVKRHLALRTVIRAQDGVPYQSILDVEGWKLGYSPAEDNPSEPELARIIAEQQSRPFNLAKDYMFRAHLVKCAEKDYVLILVLHHISADGWTLSILVEDLVAFYDAWINAREPKLKQLNIQYTDYAIWQRKHLAGSFLESGLEWWQQQLKGIKPIDLPTDFPRSALQKTSGEIFLHSLDRNLTDKLKSLAIQEGATLFMTLLAAFKVLLNKYSRQEDICVGTPIANRNRKEIEPLVGFFLNTLAIRTDLSGNPSFETLLQRLKTNTLAAFSHQEIPFEKVVDRMEPERDMSRNPIFQVLFMLLNTPEIPRLQFGDVQLSREYPEHITSIFDLTFIALETPHGIALQIEYCNELYTEQTIERMVTQYESLLEAVVDDPERRINQISLLGQEEADRLRSGLHYQAVPITPEADLLGLFRDHVRRNPEATAVIFGETNLSYRQLDERSSELAHFLRTEGLQEEDLVAIVSERSPDTIVAILGIMKAGGAFMPMDPDFPMLRIRSILEDSRASFVLTDASGQEQMADLERVQCYDLKKTLQDTKVFPAELPELKPQSSRLAYVIYTSGTTGRPKGVMIENGSLLNLALSQIDAFGLQTGQKTLQFSSLSFDAACSEIFTSLLSGGCLVIPRQEELLSATAFGQLVQKHQIDIATLPPSYHGLLGDQLLGLKTLVSAGEPLPAARAKLLVDSGIRLINAYGPTECAVCVSLTHMPLGITGSVNIGLPIPNVKVFILDEQQQLLPAGIYGELYVGGAGLARGYLNRPELSTEKFVYAGFDPQQRLYRTGDLARWNQDERLEFLGRADRQVKIRGHRIELPEIESIMLSSGLITSGAVRAIADPHGEKRLVAYVVPAPEYDAETLQQFLKHRLPTYMQPSLWVEMDVLPVLPSGKVDENALTALERQDKEAAAQQAPGTELEKKLLDIWGSLLGVAQLNVHDNFFENGGHSLLAMRVIAAMEQQLGLKTAVKNVFSYPTVRRLAGFLQNEQQISDLPPLFPRDKDLPVPLSFAQERLWFIDQLEGSVPYHIPVVLRLHGQPDIEALRSALTSLIDRHEVLRTVFQVVDGQACQIILPTPDWKLESLERAALNGESPEVFIRKKANQPFDLSRDYALRATLLEWSPDQYLLIMVLHHIAADGWSISLLIQDFVVLYQAGIKQIPAALPTISLQYADFAVWQRDFLSTTRMQEQIRWWEETLAGLEPIKLPTDFPQPEKLTRRGECLRFGFDRTMVRSLKELAQREGASLFMVLVAALKAVFHRYSGQEDITIGTPAGSRSHPELEPLVGLFVNNLVLRSDLSGDPSFSDLVQRVKNSMLAAYEHQHVPFEKIVKQLVKERDRGRSPLFQVSFALLNAPELPELTMEGLGVEYVPFEKKNAHYELVLLMNEHDEGMHVKIDYCTDLFKETTVLRLFEHYRQLLETVIADPQQKISQLQLLSKAEEQRLLRQLDRTGTGPSDAAAANLPALVEAQVQRTPDSVAVFDEYLSWTYAELNRRANQLAHYLKQNERIKAGQVIGILQDRTAHVVVAMLGVAKAGGVYLPLSSKQPRERILELLADAGVEVLLTETHFMYELNGFRGKIVIPELQLAEDDPDPGDLVLPLSGTDPVYVIYTSGSTGRPKGVSVTHGNIVNYLNCAARRYTLSLDEQAIFPFFSEVDFDLTQTSIFLPLITGGRIQVYGSSEEDRPLIMKVIEDNKADILKVTPSHLKLIRDQAVSESKLRKLIVGGEALATDLALQISHLFGEQLQIFNEYGPTEATVGCIVHEFDPRQEQGVWVPIGKPMDNNKVLLLDRHLRLVPQGMVGELFIGGAQVAHGYLNRKELTLEKFVVNPCTNDPRDILYRTGDLARLTPDGNLIFLGRQDEQVKIRGYRIEPGEIENRIREISGIVDSVVRVHTLGQDNRQLIAYVVSEAGNWNPEDWQEYLKTRLPVYMIPIRWIHIEAVPLTKNGKVDHKTLLLSEVESPTSTREYIAPRDPLEEQLASIWARMLHVEKVGIHDNFFELGGHSLLATLLLATIGKEMGLKVDINDLFASPTLATFADCLRLRGESLVLEPIEPQHRPEHIPLSFTQERLWLIDRLYGSRSYHIPIVLKLSGSPDTQAMQGAFNNLIDRQEILRTVYREDEGQPFQLILPKGNWQLDLADGVLPSGEKARMTAILRDIRVPFDLAAGYPIRAKLYRTVEAEHVLVISIHHIATDGWSSPILFRELVTFYNARRESVPAALPELPIQYADYAIWQRTALSDVDIENQLSYWKKKLEGAQPSVFQAPLPGPDAGEGKDNSVRFSLGRREYFQMKELCNQEGVTVFMFLLAVLDLLLAQHTRKTDICIGCSIANRLREELTPMIGCFINTLALRNDLSGNPRFTELLTRILKTTLEAYRHQEIPFERVLQELPASENRAANPLFNVFLNMLNQTAGMDPITAGELSINPIDIQEVDPKFDLNLYVSEFGESVLIRMVYRRERFSHEYVEGLAADLQRLISVTLEHPNRRIRSFDQLSDEEKARREDLLSDFFTDD